MKTLASRLTQAIQRREKLLPLTNALRLVNGKGDGMEGLLIDGYNKHLHVQILDGRWQAQAHEIGRLLTQAMPVEYLIVKTRRGLEIKAEILVPGDPKTIIKEHGVEFEVDLNDGLNCGLFLDMRKNRWMVGQCSKNKRILNCFSYTCSFGVHARLGGASQVINTDISPKVLERGKNNYRLNGLPVGPGEFVRADSVSFLQRAFKKGNGFDVIILDPPSFARHEAQVFQVKRDLPKAMALAAAALNPAGSLLVATNYSEISHADLERILARGLNGRRVAHLERLGQDGDFVGTNSFKESHLVGLWVRFL